MAYDYTTDAGKVRLLLNDTNETDPVFTEAEITAFLDLEGGNVKLAAAQGIDVIADDEALTSKYIRDHELSVDGTKVADSLRKRAVSLREQVDQRDDDGFFDIVDVNATGDCWPRYL